jgi:streptomycin 6-kinase
MQETAGDATEDAARVIREMSAILRASLLALSEAGGTDEACRLAAQACAALRQPQREEWHIFNKLLHKLSSRSTPIG